MLTLALGVAACAETPKQTAARIGDEDKTRAKLDRELAGLSPVRRRAAFRPMSAAR